MEQVTFAVRALAAFGIRDLLLTNAAGGVNRLFRPGDFMAGPHQHDGDESVAWSAIPKLPRFVDMTQTYDPEASKLMHQAGRESKNAVVQRSLSGSFRAHGHRRR